jgi:hypothetical protein
MLRISNWVLFWGYVTMIVCVGASGIVIAAWELPTVFDVHLDLLAPVERATFLGQYRFLKSMEFAFGVYCVVYWREIFSSRKANVVFLTGLSGGVTARLLSTVLDGWSSPVFIAFLVLEFACGVVVFLYSRRTLVSP